MGDKKYTLQDLQKIGATWIDRIRASEKREDHWIKDAEKAESAYLCGDDEGSNKDVPDFNILHSNVETIVPSIYNSTPAPDIRPRHNAKDQAAKAVSDILERAISAQIDDNRLDAEIEASAQDAFMAGRGIVRVKFDADEVAPVVEGMQPTISNERLVFEVVSWRDYREGPAKRYDSVPWVAYRHSISQSDMDDMTDEGIKDAYKNENGLQDEDQELDADIWEIWCKETGKAYFVADQSQKVLSIKPDPMGLTGFFPQAEPVQPITGTGKRTPVCPYKVYKTLAEELDKITRRINAIVSGLKVRGGVAGGTADFEALANAGDNELVPISNVEGLVAQGGLDKAIVWWPVEQAITVLRELYIQRDQTKSSIYEITGISDIIRGQGNAGETATAQQIKTEWGALRIKKMQRLIERQVRDLFVIASEIISRNFSIPTLQKMSGIQITPDIGQLLQQPLDQYRIDVESDSTIKADTSRSRREMASFLEGTASFFGAMAPIIAQAPGAAQPIIEIYSSFSRQFSLGKAAEDALDAFVESAQQAASQPKPNPEAEKAKADAAHKQAELQMDGQKLQGDQMVAKGKLQLDGEKLKIEREKLLIDREELKIKAAKAGADIQAQKDGNGPQGTVVNHSTEIDGKAFAGSMAEAMKALLDQVKQGDMTIIQNQQQNTDALAQVIKSANQNVVAALSAPKEVIRDEQGRPTGIQARIN